MTSATVRGSIMNIMKENFEGLPIWKEIESSLAIACSELPEPNTKAKLKDFTLKMVELKEYLNSKGIESKKLSFIDDEIYNHKNTSTMSLYVEEDDSMDKETIEKYARLGADSEGVVGIHQDYNYEQLKKLTNGVYKRTGFVKFYISKEQRINGKIVAEMFEHAQDIPIATLLETKKADPEFGSKYKKVALFGDNFSLAKFTALKEMNIRFHIYRFISELGKEMILLSTEKRDIGDYIIDGVETHSTDYKMLSNTAKIPTKLPYFFAHTMTNKIIKFKNHVEFSKKIEDLGICKATAWNYPFTIEKNGQGYELLQPTWYKWLTWSWLIHQSKGLANNYPMHLMILGPQSSGKSLLINSMYKKTREAREIFSGSSSTLKSLIPSFKGTPAKLGYLAESNRFAFLDEFLRCLANTRGGPDNGGREESVGLMNDLLEHQKRNAGSGVSSINVSMTARVIATTNPIRGVNTVADLVNKMDHSFLSRWVIYNQTDEHVSMIRGSSDDKLKEYNFKIDSNDFVAIIDYLHDFSAKYDMVKIMEIHESIPNMLPEVLINHYDSRHKHHIECLMDGIIKTRCVMENDMSFTATDEDYKVLEDVWFKIIGSWINSDHIKDMNVKHRINYVPEASQHLFKLICEQKAPVKRDQMKRVANYSMNDGEFRKAWSTLKEMGLIYEYKEIFRPYYMEAVLNDLGQNKL